MFFVIKSFTCFSTEYRMPLTMNEPGIKSYHPSPLRLPLRLQHLSHKFHASFAALAFPLMLTAMSGGATRETQTWPLRLTFSTRHVRGCGRTSYLRRDKQILPNGAVCGPPLASTTATTTADPKRRFSIAGRVLWESIAKCLDNIGYSEEDFTRTAKGNLKNHSLKRQLLV